MMQTSKMIKTNLSFAIIIGLSFFLIPDRALAVPDGPGKAIRTNQSVVSFQIFDGKLVRIEGNFYVVEDVTGKLHRLHLSKHATLLRGPKKPGDAVRVEVIDARAITIQ